MTRRCKTPTALDRVVIEACERKIRSTDGREMSVIDGLVTRDAAAAFQGDDQANRRIRTEYARACERKAVRDHEDKEWALRLKLKDREIFAAAERLGLPPPDLLPHPEHIRITEEGIAITGPITAEERAWWESTKDTMRWAMDGLAAARWLDRGLPSERSRHLVRKFRALIERIRRKIPPRWNWKEKIYTLGSSAEELARYQEEVEQRLEKESPEVIRDRRGGGIVAFRPGPFPASFA